MSRRPRRLMNQINVVPYIDVMLVLLIIFMITAPMVNPGQIDLPSVGQNLGQVRAPIQVTLRLDGTLSVLIPGGGAGEQSVNRGELLQKITEAQRHNSEQPVVIAADRKVRYEEVLGIMDMLRQANVKRIGLLAKPRDH